MDQVPPSHSLTVVESGSQRTGRLGDHPDQDFLAALARNAWRMADRCVGRSGWQSLVVRDRTHLTTAQEIVEDLEAHLSLTTNGGRIRPVATIYHPSVRFRSEQLIRYAGDPQYAGYAATCRRLGWHGTDHPFEVLPVAFELPDGTLYLASLDRSLILEVPIRHPVVPWSCDPGLRWHAAPVISNMLLRNDGRYWPCVFGGWYATDEIPDATSLRRDGSTSCRPSPIRSVCPATHAWSRSGRTSRSASCTGRWSTRSGGQA
jgi:nitric-oxide synthase